MNQQTKKSIITSNWCESSNEPRQLWEACCQLKLLDFFKLKPYMKRSRELQTQSTEIELQDFDWRQTAECRFN